MCRFASAFGTFLAATAVIGAGAGVFGTTGTTILTDIYAENDTIAVSISQIAATLGTLFLPVIAGLITGVASWRMGIGYVIPAFAAVAVGLWFTVPAETSPTVEVQTQTLKHVFIDIGQSFSSRDLF